MRLRDMFERLRSDEAASRQASAGGPEGGANLDEFRRLADELLAAGDEAIRKALSGDSQRFLQANRQQGGQ